MKVDGHQMNRYDLLYWASTPVTAPFFLGKYFLRGKYHESLPSMFGRRLPEEPLPDTEDDAPRIWIHAVSVGEVVAARAVAEQLVKALPNAEFIVSTVTETGQEMARRQFDGIAKAVFFYPIDLSKNVERFLDTYRPDVFIMMETELWPNMLNLAGKRGVKIFMLNGRISDHSYPSYKRFRSVFRGPLSQLRAAAVQTETDAERLRSLCGDGAEIAVTGNCKFDTPDKALTDDEKRAQREKFLISDDRVVVVAGSSHPGEEEIFLDAWQKACRELRPATLVLAPRHPERFEQVAAIVARHNLTCSLSTRPDKRDPQVLLLNEMGVLARAYGIASIAIVGGSFVPIGGHNILEPAIHSAPVVYGPHMHKQREMLRILDGAGGGIQVEPEKLASTLADLMRDEARRADHGAKARAAIEANRGSAKRGVDLILPHIVG